MWNATVEAWPDMDSAVLAEWLQAALENAGVSQAALARWMTAALGRSIDRAAVNKMVKGARDIAADELLVAARLLNAQIPTEYTKTVRLSGYVGAGQAIYPFDDTDPADYVEAPPTMERGTTAVEVRGESMLPLYESGALLYYSKMLPPEEMRGRQAIVHVSDGRTLVKILRRGAEPGLWTLGSLNAPDIEDVVVDWAAPIDWVKPRQ